MAFNPATYVPGDAWESGDFLVRASSAPKIVVTTNTPGESTPPSFFEPRDGHNTSKRRVEVAVTTDDAVPIFEVELQRSFDDGVTWNTLRKFSNAEGECSIEYATFYKMRLIYLSGSSMATLRLHQDL